MPAFAATRPEGRHCPCEARARLSLTAHGTRRFLTNANQSHGEGGNRQRLIRGGAGGKHAAAAQEQIGVIVAALLRRDIGSTVGDV
jgi:hypothetical protein